MSISCRILAPVLPLKRGLDSLAEVAGDVWTSDWSVDIGSRPFPSVAEAKTAECTGGPPGVQQNLVNCCPKTIKREPRNARRRRGGSCRARAPVGVGRSRPPASQD